MFLLCARGLQQHRVTGFMLLLWCKMFTIASFHGFLLSLFLSEVYCNIVLITGSCRQCCIHRHRVTGFMLLCVRGLQHHRVTVLIMLSVYSIIVLRGSCCCVQEVYSIIVLRGSCCYCYVKGLQHYRVLVMFLLLIQLIYFFITALIIADDQLFCVRVVSIDNTN